MDNLTEVFKVLSDETRLRILMLLHQGDLCVCQICEILEAPQPRISKNLSKLRDLNWVVDERREKFVYYKLNHKDAVWSEIINHIMTHIESYPIIKQDLARLNLKEVALKQCVQKMEG